MKKLYFLILMCVGTYAAIGQSQAGAYASATIVSPVGAELSGDMDNGSSVLNNKNNFINVSSKQPGKSSNSSYTEHKVPSVASIKILGSVNVYDVSVQADPIILRDAYNDALKATVALGKFYSTERFQTSDATINITAVINVNAAQAKGTYTCTTPYTVTINFN